MGVKLASLTLRETLRLRVFENRVLGRIFWLKRDEVRGEWRKLHKEERNDLYNSPNIFRVIKSRRMRWTGRIACMGVRRDVYRVLVGKPKGKRPLGRPRRRWEDSINHLTPNGHYMGRTAQLTSRCSILYIYSTNMPTEYFKHAS